MLALMAVAAAVQPLAAQPARHQLPPAAAAAAPAAPPPAAAFSRAETEAVLREAFTAIAERYLHPVALPDLAAAALGELARLEPSLALARDGREWRLAAAGQPLGAMRAPGPADAAGWAALVATLAAGAQATQGLRGTGQPAQMAALMEGVAARLDPYSRYVPAPEARAAQHRRRGQGGIGVRAIPAADGAAIIEVIPESPADHAGLAEGDRIVAINGVRTRGLGEDALAARLAGEEDTRLVLAVRPLRAREVRQVALIRSLVVPLSVRAERRGAVSVFRLSTFNRLTDQHLARAILEAQAQAPLTGIVLDLRGNRGGLLRQAVAVADLFLAQGEIAATRGRHADAARTYVADGADLTGGLPLVVLVDGLTASAAEIVAASLAARGRAAVLGSASMGKGLVQTVVRLPDQGELVLTWSRVLVPPGRPLQGFGVVPVLCTADGIEAALQGLASLRAGAGGTPGARAGCPPRDGGPADLDAALALLADAAALAAALGAPPPAAAAPPRPGDSLAGAR
jgi:carboxyl-terminal processing protease